MTAALEIHGVRKTFGDKVAIESLDLAIPQGATYGLIGPSGAGKTTAIRMIMSILFPDRGTHQRVRPGLGTGCQGPHRLPARGARLVPQNDGRRVPHVHGMPEGSHARPGLRTRRPAAGPAGARRVTAKKCEDLSKGMLQRVQFVAAIINEPDLLILDEPFGGLDPVSVRLLKEVIAEEHQRGATIIFSTHVMAHAEELCEQIVMIHQGRKVLDEPMSGLRRQYDTRRILLEPLDPGANLLALQGVAGVETSSSTIRVARSGCSPAPIRRRRPRHRRAWSRRRALNWPASVSKTSSSAWSVSPAAATNRRRPCARTCRASPNRSRSMSVSLQRIGLVAGRDYKASDHLAGVPDRPAGDAGADGDVRGLDAAHSQFAQSAGRGEVAVIDATGKVAAATATGTGARGN